jgi:peptide-methionine (S)-S-oxide reductase
MHYLILFILQLSLIHNKELKAMSTEQNLNKQQKTIILGAGCFWCVEAIFEQLKGVEKVESGYCGGESINPTYEEVCSGNSKHIEVCKITYHPSVISFEDLLSIFWQIHDPTTPNRQGNDIGEQYQSVVFCNNEIELKIAQEMKDSLNKNKVFKQAVVTEIRSMKPFYKAENYHQNYYNNNSYQPYCKFVVQPKLEKFKKSYKEQLKSNQ